MGERNSFRVFDGSVPADLDVWRTLWTGWQGHEVFAHPGYVSLYSGPTSRPMCAVFGSRERGIILPFLLRDIERRDSGPSRLVGATDVTSPYGYGGPFFSGDIDEKDIANFWDAWSGWAKEHSVVSEFLRFGPAGESTCCYPGTVVTTGSTVVRDLAMDSETLWMDFEHKVRKNVKKAQRSGITVRTVSDCTGVNSFIPVYTSTMDRRRADTSYYFSREFFDRLCSDLEGSYAFFHATLDGDIVSTELVLISDEIVYSFLGGTDPRAFPARPNDLLKFTIIEWAQAHGKKSFVLGGGYQPDDGIFRYKLSFAPSGMVPFEVGRRVLDEELYGLALLERDAMEHDRTGATWKPQAGYFPAYRA